MYATFFRRALLALAAACALHAAAGACAAQSFRVPGDAGREWIDTGLDLKPGTLVRLAAKGEVDVGAGRGVFGPEGTRKFEDVPGYPAETTYRYGLVARLTQGRTNPEDDLRDQWSYGERQDYCAARGGHLWLTFNDNETKDNKGEFAVDVTLGACAAQSTTLGELRGRFRVTLNGFTVNRATAGESFNRDGAGDEVFVRADVFVLRGAPGGGFEVVSHTSLRSPLMGDTSGFPGRERAGTASPTGGLRSGDAYPSPAPWARTQDPTSTRLPLLLWEGELPRETSARMSVVIIPTVWEWDEPAAGEFGRAWDERLYPYMSDIFARYGPRFDATEVGPAYQTFEPLSWFPYRAVANVPVGRSLSQVISNGAVSDAVEYSFNMAELTLTYRSASAAARASRLTARTALEAARGGFRGANGLVEMTYADRWLTGTSADDHTANYTLYVQFESLN